MRTITLTKIRLFTNIYLLTISESRFFQIDRNVGITNKNLKNSYIVFTFIIFDSKAFTLTFNLGLNV